MLKKHIFAGSSPKSFPEGSGRRLGATWVVWGCHGTSWVRLRGLLGAFQEPKWLQERARNRSQRGLGGVLGRRGSSGGVLGRPGRVWEASGDGFGRLSGAILGDMAPKSVCAEFVMVVVGSFLLVLQRLNTSLEHGGPAIASAVGYSSPAVDNKTSIHPTMSALAPTRWKGSLQS